MSDLTTLPYRFETDPAGHLREVAAAIRSDEALAPSSRHSVMLALADLLDRYGQHAAAAEDSAGYAADPEMLLGIAAARAYLVGGPRPIPVEPPVGSQVLDVDGDVWTRDDRGWWSIGPGWEGTAADPDRSSWGDVQRWRPLTLVRSGAEA